MAYLGLCVVGFVIWDFGFVLSLGVGIIYVFVCLGGFVTNFGYVVIDWCWVFGMDCGCLIGFDFGD